MNRSEMQRLTPNHLQRMALNHLHGTFSEFVKQPTQTQLDRLERELREYREFLKTRH